MARPVKKIENEKLIVEEQFSLLMQELKKGLERIEILEKEKELQHYWNEKIQDSLNSFEEKIKKPEGKSINKVEKFNDEVPSTVESYNGMKMEASDKIQSMVNAIRILPPNMIVNGRQLKENVEAICGFKVLDEMMDEVYEVVNNDPRGN